jgi:predicted DNA-binding protein
MDAEEFDKKFDDGLEDIMEYVDLSSRVRPNRDVKRVNVDLPLWMVEALDNEAKRLGVTRQSVIKVWLSEKIDQHWREMEAERASRKKQTG